jgi:hypothetical protein
MKVEEAFQGVGRVFLDSAPVIYYVEARAEFAAIVYPIFRSLGEGEFEGIASPVTLAECLVKPKQLERVDLVQGFTNLLTNTEGIVFVTLGEQVGVSSRNAIALSLEAPRCLTNCNGDRGSL